MKFRCGIRGGYMEVVGLDADVVYEIQKLTSATLCTNSLGQVHLFFTTIPLTITNWT